MSRSSHSHDDDWLSPQAYLAWERASEQRHEYEAGRVIAMAGASADHNRIVGNLHVALRAHLDGAGCEVFLQDLRVAIAGARYVYPDVVVCGEAAWADDNFDVLLNPSLVAEVLSPSTELRDRGEKLFAYQRLPSLQDYLIVHQEVARVEHFSHQGPAWLYQRYEGLEGQVALPGLGLSLPLTLLYQRVDFPPQAYLPPSP